MTEKLVAIAYEFSPLKANLIRTRLEADGIECFLAGETVTSVVGPFSHAAASWEHPEGNIAIQVRASDAAEARTILQELEDSSDDEDDEEMRIPSRPSLVLTFFRLLVVGWLSILIAGVISSPTNNWLLGMLVGMAAFVGLSVLAFKKSFKSER